MAQKDNILQELRELNSSIAKIGNQPVFAVPEGYFDNLAAEVLKRIKASEAEETLPAIFNQLPKNNPYQVPAGYFESLENRVSAIINDQTQTAQKELEELSPLLSKLNKVTPYQVPEGYFERVEIPAAKTGAKVISITRHKWLRYAVAAMVIGFIATLFVITQNKNKIDPNADSYAWVKKNVKKVSTDELDEFIELTDIKNTVASLQKTEDIKDLVKDVPEKEIQQLLNDADVLFDPAADELLMN